MSERNASRIALCLLPFAIACGKTTADESSRSEPRLLAYIADSQTLGSFELHVADVNEPGVPSEIISMDQASVHLAEWSPDGRFLAFATDSALWVADADADFEPRQIHGPALGLSWSANGRHLAFYDNAAAPLLVIADLLGEHPNVLEPLNEVTSYEHSWSPAGDAYVFARSDRGGATGEWLVARPGAPVRALSPIGSETRRPVWSPDGRYLAIVGAPEDKSQPLHLLDLASDGAPRLLEPDVSDPQFSPDSRLLLARGHLDVLLAFRLGDAPETTRQVVTPQLGGWAIGNGGGTLVYGADLDLEPGRELYAATLTDGAISAARLLHERVHDFAIGQASDLIVFRRDYSEQLFVVRGDGGPAEALHEATRVGTSLGWLSPSGGRSLLELQPLGAGSPEVIEHRVVGLSALETLFEFTIPDDTRIADPKWQADARFSFVHAIGAAEGTKGWQTLYVGDVEAQTLITVYASSSNLREVRWTGWQP